MNLKTKEGLTKIELVCRYRQFILDFGMGFHPDTDGGDYSPKLSKKEQNDYNESLGIFEDMFEDKIYEIACNVFDFIYGIEFEIKFGKSF